MNGQRCPGQDSRFLTPQDVTEAECPGCGERVEFWPDEFVRACPNCKHRVSNPKANLRCLEWCAGAEQCLEQIRSAGVSLAEAREYVKRRPLHSAAKPE